jgi:hypothetical protein
MANGSEAYSIMRNLGVGVTNKDLDRIKSDVVFAKKQSGKIFLQVESHGEAYYIDINGLAHYLKDGDAAYNIMRELGLGIKTIDLTKINLSDKDATTSVATSTPPPPVVTTVDYDVKIVSSTCGFTPFTSNYGTALEHVRAVISGTAQGPVGARLELPIPVWSDDVWNCGDWTKTSGALITVGSTCTRKEGQATTTTWTVDTGGEEQGSFLKGKTRYYTAKIYKKGDIYSQKEDQTSYICQ